MSTWNDNSNDNVRPTDVETPERRWHRFATEQHTRAGMVPGPAVVLPTSPIDHQAAAAAEEARRLVEEARIEATVIVSYARSQAAAIIANAQVERARILASAAPGAPAVPGGAPEIDLRLPVASASI